MGGEQAGQFTIQQPPGWDQATIHTITGPSHEGFQPNIVVTVQRLPSARLARDLAHDQMEALKRNLAQFRLLNESSLTVSNLPAYELEYGWVDDKKRSLHLRQIYVTISQMAYILTATCLSTQRPAFEDSLRSSINSFQLIG
jgi:hypothetical protein